MSKYFEDCKSIQFSQGINIDAVLEAVSNKYIGSNPAQPLIFRLSSSKGFKRNSEYLYVFDFQNIYPDAVNEQVVYAWAKIWSDDERRETFKAVPHSPMEVFVNGTQAYKSNYYEEKNSASQNPVQAGLLKGWNSIVICFSKTALGFGGEFGSSFFKYKPCHFLSPTLEREGQEGFIYTLPMERLENLPSLPQEEKLSSVKWYPECSWNENQAAMGQLVRIYGRNPGRFAYGWTKALLTGRNGSSYQLTGESTGRLSVFVDGNKVFETQAKGQFKEDFKTHAGLSNIIVESECGENDWGFHLSITQDGQGIVPISPCALKGTADPWIYAGPFQNKQKPELLASMSKLLKTINGDDYWRADLPDMYVRPFLETKNFGQWNYPVGVTLYGLLKTGKMLGRQDISDYVKHHVELCTGFYKYALWDSKKFGATGVDAQIASIESLDDCGSFASTMLELSFGEDLDGYREIADTVADFVSNKLTRLPDGTMYRYKSSLPEMKNTVWLDDLYMSVPFLSRYYKLTGDRSYLDDAVKQFRLYKEKMYIPGLNVMSHVYYTDRLIASGVPWGRGNGWVLFSLSELLQIVPQDYEYRDKLLGIFRGLCEGYRALQDDDGMWHQVLNDEESYEESSCTSMFICSFARGVRNGWYNADADKYSDAVIKGWNGLTRNAIDSDGNIYGICKGSGHSFTPRYYKYELNWVLNDIHGIGILLLAGAETKQMLNHLKNKI